MAAHGAQAAEALKAALEEKHAAAEARLAHARLGRADEGASKADKTPSKASADATAAAEPSEAELEKRRAAIAAKLEAATARAAAQKQDKAHKVAAHLQKVKLASPTKPANKPAPVDGEPDDVAALEQRVLHTEEDELPAPPAQDPFEEQAAEAKPARCVIS